MKLNDYSHGQIYVIRPLVLNLGSFRTFIVTLYTYLGYLNSSWKS